MKAWPQRARRFAEGAGLPPLRPPVKAALEDRDPGQPCLVACSGGADSVFLVLYLLARLPAEAAASLHLVHFNHRLRGADAEADAAFVRELAGELGLALSIGHPEAPPAPDEDSLRNARYDWMTTVYHSVKAAALFLGHHADDRLESQLMALFSGSGPAGLAAPVPVKRFPDGQLRLRPLLDLRRVQIEAALRAAGIPWREDASNADPAYTRNWIRHRLIPGIKAHFPQDIHAGSARTAHLMAEILQFLDARINQLSPDTGDPETFQFGALTGQPRALVRRAFMGWWLRHHPDSRISASALERILDGLTGSAERVPVDIGRGWRLVPGSGDCLRLEQSADTRPQEWGGTASWNPAAGPLFLPDGSRLTGGEITLSASASPPYAEANPRREAWIRPPDGPLRIRNWRPGDRYCPLGAPGTRKLQDWFTDRKIPLEQRHRLPVLLTGSSEILWVPGFPPAQSACLGPGDKRALKLTYLTQSAVFSLDYGRSI